jgi:chromosomal replication initiation ATPase DnaA
MEHNNEKELLQIRDDIRMVLEKIDTILENNRIVKYTPNEIIRLLCQYFHTSRDKLIERSKYRKTIMRKRIAIKLLYEHCGMTYKEIACIFNYKGHDNAIYHHNRINEELSNEIYCNKETKRIYGEVLKHIKLEPKLHP